MARKKMNPRAIRRELARSTEKFARDAERLFLLSTGGSPGLPIELASASQVEIHAEGMPCPICEGALRVEEHVAETIGGVRLRVARVACVMCAAKRSLYFRLGSPLPS